MGMSVLVINLFLPGMRRRRWVAGVGSRAFMRAVGIRFSVQGIERLPATPCVVVANHASYIDALAIVAALPPDFAFVIKKEMVKVPLAGLLLRRLGSQFVERFDRHKGATDARRVLKLAAGGQSLMFFPEGTFDQNRHIGRFLGGAFTTAQRNQLPLVAVAIHGTPRSDAARRNPHLSPPNPGADFGRHGRRRCPHQEPRTHCRGGGRAHGALNLALQL